MPADRSYRKPRAGPSVPRPNAPPGVEKHKPQALQHRTGDGIPGLSKIKASIRQTKRLLAKEGIEPGLKIQTQRRLESLEGDLAKAEKRNVEMKNGTKYHMVKFVERQKLLRIIKKQKRASEKTESSSIKVSSAETKLEHARIMLNYVLNFPNTEKYISLFADQTTEDAKASLPKHLEPSISSSSENDKPSQRRLEILNEMRRLMADGTLSQTPEETGSTETKQRVELSLSSKKGVKAEMGSVPDDAGLATENVETTEMSEKKKAKKEKKAKNTEKKAEVVPEGGDDFFED